MSGPSLTLAATYVRHMAAFIGADQLEPWLRQVGLRPHDLDVGMLSLPLQDLATLLLDAMARSNEPALGLFLGERLETRTHGLVATAALHSRTLRDVLDVAARYVPVRFSLVTTSYAVHDDEIRLAVKLQAALGPIERPLLEAVVMSIRNVLDSVSLGAFTIDALCFSFAAPEYAALARDLARTDVHYDDTWTGLVLRAEALDTPLKMADPRIFEDAEEICRRRLAELEANELTSTRVRRLLLEHDNGMPSQLAIARRLHLTPRTLHRRLVEESTSYRKIVDEERFRLAADHLVARRASIDEIAFMLGYTDVSNFRRAFRRWAGMPPAVFRQRRNG